MSGGGSLYRNLFKGKVSLRRIHYLYRTEWVTGSKPSAGFAEKDGNRVKAI